MEFLDDKEKRYIEYFGEPITVAHDIVTSPHVDLYIFPTQENDFVYLTKGLDEIGFRELMFLTANQEKWPAFYAQAVCKHQITSQEKFAELNTYNNVEPILEAAGFSQAVMLSPKIVGLDADEMTTKLGLESSPLYVFPLTKAELAVGLENGSQALLEKIMTLPSPLGDVSRVSSV